VVVYEGGEVLEEWALPAGRHCSSFSAEAAAMAGAVAWLEERRGVSRVSLVTDSLSLVDALRGVAGEGKVRRIREALWRMHDRGVETVLVWVPSHCGVEGNERADARAGEGGQLDQAPVGLDGATREALIRRRVVQPPMQHQRLRGRYEGGIREGEEDGMTREERSDLSRFRTGHHPALRSWRARVEGGDPKCRLCGAPEETAEHLWVECPEVEDLRFRWGLGQDVRELVDGPVPAVTFLRKILRRLGA
jgi:ribonuclease HI